MQPQGVMKYRKILIKLLTTVAALFVLVFLPVNALAHCDTMDGPVVKAAQRALVTRNVNLVLIWVQKEDEPVISKRFQEVLAVRRLGGEARNLADAYFFETVVRLHRAGEGEPYNGLRPAGTDVGPVIPVADKAFKDGSVSALLKLLPAAAAADIEAKFKEAIAKRSFNENDVGAGREYVKAYVSFLHLVEHVYEEKSNGSTQ